MSEKTGLPARTAASGRAAPRRGFPVILLAIIAFFTGNSLPSLSLQARSFLQHHYNSYFPAGPSYTVADFESAKCPPQPPLISKGSDWNPLHDDIFVELASKRISKAVQINTVSFDGMPMEAADPAFDKHYDFSKWLESEFSKLYQKPLKHEYVNTHGHLYTWEGSNPKLKPILLMAHTDTVPVLPATLDAWTFEPWSGKIEADVLPDTPGKWIWGRGASDCKNQLLGIFNAVERLVTEGLQT